LGGKNWTRNGVDGFFMKTVSKVMIGILLVLATSACSNSQVGTITETKKDNQYVDTTSKKDATVTLINKQTIPLSGAPSCPPRAKDTVEILPKVEDYVGKIFDGNEIIQILDHSQLTKNEISEEGSVFIEIPVKHVIAVLATKERHMLWIMKLLCHEQSDNPFYQITDAINIPELGKEERIYLHPERMCKHPKGGEIFAIGKKESIDREITTNLTLVWKIIWPEGKIIQIDNTEVQCYANAGMVY
jgi:hypothetical protein